MKHVKYLAIIMSLILLAMACNLGSTPTPAGITVPTPVSADEGNAPPQPQQPTLPPVTPVTIQASTTAVFNAANSGSLCPKRSPELELGSAPSIIGEIDDEWRCEGYWTFNIPELPDKAKILSATFTPGNCSRVGDPFAFGPMTFGHRSVGLIDVADYGGYPDGVTLHQACPPNFDVTSFVRGSYKNGSVQFVASFENSDYGNGTGDYVSYSGTTPILTIEYSYVQ